MQTNVGLSRSAAVQRRSAVRCRIASLTVILLAVAACGDGATEPVTPPAAVVSIVVTPAEHVLGVGETFRLEAVARSSSGDTIRNAPVSWTSNDTSVARVSSGGMVTARKAGTARITAQSGTRSAYASITVQESNPLPVIAALSPASVAAGGPEFTLTITGTGFRPNVRVQWNGMARPTEYVSPTEVRARIWAGDLTEVRTVRVSVVNAPPGGGASAEADFQVVPQTAPVASIVLTHAVAITTVGAPVPVSATVRDAAGNVLTDRLITWSSSNQLVATVNGAGLVQPTGVGEAVITAASEGRAATVALSVGTRATHLILDDATGLASLDLRLGGAPVRFWQHEPGTRASDPSVSPDGRWIAYVIDRGAVQDVAVFDQAERTYRYVTSDGSSAQPAWSPAGDRIAFTSRRDGRSDVWLMNPDGSGKVNLTADLPTGFESQNPAWSPDGTRIVFAGGGSQAIRGLYVMKADGTARQQLTFGHVDTEPTWAFDFVVFTRRAADGSSDLFQARVSGGPLVRLTDLGNAHSPAWSPDGRWIAFVSGASVAGRGDILVVRPFGEDTRPLWLASTPGGGGLNPTWVSHH